MNEETKQFIRDFFKGTSIDLQPVTDVTFFTYTDGGTGVTLETAHKPFLFDVPKDWQLPTLTSKEETQHREQHNEPQP